MRAFLPHSSHLLRAKYRLRPHRRSRWPGHLLIALTRNVPTLSELGGRSFTQDGAEGLQGRSVAPAFAPHQVERPLDP